MLMIGGWMTAEGQSAAHASVGLSFDELPFEYNILLID